MICSSPFLALHLQPQPTLSAFASSRCQSETSARNILLCCIQNKQSTQTINSAQFSGRRRLQEQRHIIKLYQEVDRENNSDIPDLKYENSFRIPPFPGCNKRPPFFFILFYKLYESSLERGTSFKQLLIPLQGPETAEFLEDQAEVER